MRFGLNAVPAGPCVASSECSVVRFRVVLLLHANTGGHVSGMVFWLVLHSTQQCCAICSGLWLHSPQSGFLSCSGANYWQSLIVRICSWLHFETNLFIERLPEMVAQMTLCACARQVPAASARLVDASVDTVHAARLPPFRPALGAQVQTSGTLIANSLQQERRTPHAFACILDRGFLFSSFITCAACRSRHTSVSGCQ